jgi:hypothetical protein
MNHIIEISVKGNCELFIDSKSHKVKSLKYTISGNGSSMCLGLFDRLKAIPQICYLKLPGMDTQVHLAVVDSQDTCGRDLNHLHLIPATPKELKKLIRYVESYATHLSKSVLEK